MPELLPNSEPDDLEKETLSEDEILALISQHAAHTSGGGFTSTQGDELQTRRRKALEYYLGLPNGKEVEGRSDLTSTDVADAVDQILPQIVEAVLPSSEVVTFQATSADDEQQAAVESAYVHSLIKQDDHFIQLQAAIKEALLQNNGFVEVGVRKNITTDQQTFIGLSEQEIQELADTQDGTIVEARPSTNSMPELPLYDLLVDIRTENDELFVEAIANEDFLYSSEHDEVSLESCHFTARLSYVTRSELINRGYDPEVVMELPANSAERIDSDRNYRRTYRGRTDVHSGGESTTDEHSAIIECAHIVMRLDVNGEGRTRLYSLFTDGVRNPTSILEMKEIPHTPFVNMVANILPHDPIGVSVHDRIREIQDQKTNMMRSILDNLHLMNNQRLLVEEGQVEADTLNLSRPGGHITIKRQGAVVPLPTPQLPADSMRMLDYFDRQRGARTGVDAQGPAGPHNIGGSSIGSEGVARIMTASEKVVGLMIRNIAETGIRPIVLKLRALTIMYKTDIAQFHYRRDWMEINPSEWIKTRKAEIKVGTGTGDRAKKEASIANILTLLEKVQAVEGQTIVTPHHIYNALVDYARASGISEPERYFQDPKDNPPPPEPDEGDDPEEMMAKAQIMIGQAELEKNKVDLATERAELSHSQEKERLKNEIEALKLQLESAKAEATMRFDYHELEEKLALEREKLEVEKQKLEG